MSTFADRVRGTSDKEPPANQRFHGKYRGTVVNNVDPEMRNRLMVIVPDISNVIPTTWAEACFPPGHSYTPSLGAGVWVEFEQGGPDFPVWTGCLAGSAIDLPLLSKLTPPGLGQTTVSSPLTQFAISVSDSPAVGITMKTATGAGMIRMTEESIMIISGGTSIVIGAGTVTITGNVVVV